MAEPTALNQNPVTVAAAVASFAGALLTWGLDSVEFPPAVEASGYVLGIAVIAALVGRITQKYHTDPKGS